MTTESNITVPDILLDRDEQLIEYLKLNKTRGERYEFYLCLFLYRQVQPNLITLSAGSDDLRLMLLQEHVEFFVQSVVSL